MKENKKNVQEEVMETVETVEVERTDIEIVEEEKKPGKLAKAGGFIKKHGKKIAIGAGVALAGAAVFVVKALMNARAGEDADLDFIDALEGTADIDETVIIDLPPEDVEINE